MKLELVYNEIESSEFFKRNSPGRVENSVMVGRQRDSQLQPSGPDDI